MWLLVIDTAGPKGGVLLAQEDGSSAGGHRVDPKVEILGVRELHPRLFSAELIPAIAELLRSAQLQLADVDAFAVVSGPGSFTGLRVGLAAVKAMAEATGKPILTVSHLAVMASMAAQLPTGKPAEELMHILLDAGRGEFYHGIYRDEGKTRVAESFETLDVLTEKMQERPGLVVVLEMTVKTALQDVDRLKFCELSPPTVQDALPLAMEEWRARRFHDPVSVDANYLRRSDAVVMVRPKAELTEPIAQSQEMK